MNSEELAAAGVALPAVPSRAEVIAAALDALEDNDNHAATVILKTALRNAVVALAPAVRPKNDNDALLIDNLVRACLGRDSGAIDVARMALRQRMNELRTDGVMVGAQAVRPDTTARDTAAHGARAAPPMANVVAQNGRACMEQADGPHDCGLSKGSR